MTNEQTDTDYQKCRRQNDTLWEPHDELDSLLHANQLSSKMVDSEVITNWLRKLHNIVQDGLERSCYPFPEQEKQQ